MKKLPSYDSFTRFIRNFDNELLQKLMQSAVLKAAELMLIDSSLIALDSTPVKANVRNNNPKSFQSNKFSKEHPPKADNDCTLGVQTASNQINERKFEYYWGYKDHVLVDCISGLPICEITTGANVSDSTVTLELLERTNKFLPLDECCFLGDKAYDVKAIYNAIRESYNGECCDYERTLFILIIESEKARIGIYVPFELFQFSCIYITPSVMMTLIKRHCAKITILNLINNIV